MSPPAPGFLPPWLRTPRPAVAGLFRPPPSRRDPPGRPGHTGRAARLLVALDPAIAIDEGAILFGHGGDRQDERAPGEFLALNRAQHDHGRHSARPPRPPSASTSSSTTSGALAARFTAAAQSVLKPSRRAPSPLGARSARAPDSGTPASGASFSPSGTCTAAVSVVPASSALTRPSDSTEAPSGREHYRLAPRLAPARPAGPVPFPVGGLEPVALAHQRRLDPVAPVHPAIVHPAGIADEVAIDLEIGPGPEPDDGVVAGIDHDVAALGAAGADAGGLVEIPGAGLVEKVLGDQRSDRAEIHDVAGPGVVQQLARDQCR